MDLSVPLLRDEELEYFYRVYVARQLQRRGVKFITFLSLRGMYDNKSASVNYLTGTAQRGLIGAVIPWDQKPPNIFHRSAANRTARRLGVLLKSFWFFIAGGMASNVRGRTLQSRATRWRWKGRRKT